MDKTHSSILAWKIPWTEEPFRLQSMGSYFLKAGASLGVGALYHVFHVWN